MSLAKYLLRQVKPCRETDPAITFKTSRLIIGKRPNPSQRKVLTNLRLRVFMTLKQACSPEYQGAQGAFKDSMIHWILQFTLLIAFRCVLHRCESQEIRCWKFYFVIKFNTFIDFVFYKWIGVRSLARVTIPNKCTGLESESSDSKLSWTSYIH